MEKIDEEAKTDYSVIIPVKEEEKYFNKNIFLHEV